MTRFDKIAAILSIPIGVIFLALGVFGLFAGSSANFQLPPILGALPFFLGWSMSVTIIRFWRSSGNESSEDEPPSAMYLKFLEEHPEFRNAPKKLQWGGFHKWLDRVPPPTSEG
jgi:hypothetical protein